ncbi:hypothetical protein CW674_05150 [Macrococcoides caseolyticum]|uniref:hypothetical protein n=1 Tax=Macrococcoides caseolyticum TaxID=69966 RepID=UPI000C34B4BC|nr:hypothetical protein [Macrococcus caseolyticus]PKE65695.1 hypothetical protein CW674_05150 [Macrococcus caseolyticus]
MEMNRFDIYKELWTKSRTAFAEEHNIEFTNLKKVIEVHNIPLPDSKYLYDYRRGVIGTLTPIEGEDYIIKIDEKLSEKTKITNKWSYFDDDKIEEIYNVYTELKIPDKVKRHHKIITKHKDYLTSERRRKREAEMNPWGHSYYRPESMKVLNASHISKEALPDFYKLCDTLFRAVESLKFKVSVDEEYINFQIHCKDKQVKKNDIMFEKMNVFQIKLKFKEKTKRVKRDDDRYSSYDYINTGYFKAELIGVYPWSNNVHGINREYPGTDDHDNLLKKIFERIFELPQLLHDAEIEYIEKQNEEKRKRIEAEQLRKSRESEFNKIKSLISEYKLHKEIKALTEYIKEYKLKNATMEEMMWYKETLTWLKDADKVDKSLGDRNHEQIVKFLLNEMKESDVDFYDPSKYEWWR